MTSLYLLHTTLYVSVVGVVCTYKGGVFFLKKQKWEFRGAEFKVCVCSITYFFFSFFSLPLRFRLVLSPSSHDVMYILT